MQTTSRFDTKNASTEQNHHGIQDKTLKLPNYQTENVDQGDLIVYGSCILFGNIYICPA